MDEKLITFQATVNPGLEFIVYFGVCEVCMSICFIPCVYFNLFDHSSVCDIFHSCTYLTLVVSKKESFTYIQHRSIKIPSKFISELSEHFEAV